MNKKCKDIVDLIGEGGHSRSMASCPNSKVFTGIESWDEFWAGAVDPDLDVCCFILEVPDSGDLESLVELQTSVSVASGTVRSLELRFFEGFSGNIGVSLDLESNSQVSLKLLGRFESDDSMNLEISSTQNAKDSKFIFESRFVSSPKSNINIHTEGGLGASAIGSVCNYSMKVLEIGAKGVKDSSKSGKITCWPNVATSCPESDLKHGFSVDRIPDDVYAYMSNRGISDDKIDELYSWGFLRN